MVCSHTFLIHIIKLCSLEVNWHIRIQIRNKKLVINIYFQVHYHDAKLPNSENDLSLMSFLLRNNNQNC
jgi:hypothetical protein